MERDEESGLEYHNARYYVPWLGRWTAPDTHADELDGNRYAYVKNNPVVHRDRNGLFEEPVHGVTTYRLALAAGFTKEDAAKIAIATAGMDHDEATRPGDGIGEMQAQIWRGRTQEYHYPTQEAALDRINSDIKGGVKDLEEFGRHLHSLEDVGFKEAAGPHNRSKDRALSPVVGIIGAWALSGGVITIIETAKANFSTAANIALGVLAAVLIAFGLYATIFAFRAEGTGHPSYQTERGEWSDSFHHYADEAFQDPKANTEELRRIYAKLKEAAAKRYGGKAVADDAAAEAAIKDVVTADDACQINNLINTPTADTTGNPAPSYADIVKKLGRWAPDKIDVSLDRGREFTYRPGIQVCPVPAR
jgi:RHS repeat-associated protein